MIIGAECTGNNPDGIVVYPAGLQCRNDNPMKYSGSWLKA